MRFSYVNDTAAPKSPEVLVPSGCMEIVLGLFGAMAISQSRVSPRSVIETLVYLSALRRAKRWYVRCRADALYRRPLSMDVFSSRTEGLRGSGRSSDSVSVSVVSRCPALWYVIFPRVYTGCSVSEERLLALYRVRRRVTSTFVEPAMVSA